VLLPRVLSDDPSSQASSTTTASGPATPSSPAPSSSPPSSSPASSGPASSSPAGRSASPSPAPAATGAAVTAPAGFTRYTNGFSVIVPAGWRPVRRGTRIDFDDPASSRFLRIDTSDHALPDPYQNWIDYERTFRKGKTDYRRIGIRRVPAYRAGAGWSTADWEFTLGGTHVLDRNIRVNASRAHAIYWSTPSSQWSTADSRRIFDLAAASFVPAPTGG
jgi:eukaryotic-like serine/threonine-protein kinase